MLVVSNGDDELLRLGAARRAWHFPQQEDGVWAGYHPADSAEAIAHLEALRDRGATHILIPQTAFWWLDYYTGLRDRLMTSEGYGATRDCVIAQLPSADRFSQIEVGGEA